MLLAVSAQVRADGKFTFYTAKEVILPSGTDYVSVWMQFVGDNGKAKRVPVVSIYGDAGTDPKTGIDWTRMNRANEVVKRLTTYLVQYPDLAQDLVPGNVNSCTVLTPDPTDPSNYIITADPLSVRNTTGGTSDDPNVWAQTVVTSIRDALTGKQTRDALFDYQLKLEYDVPNPSPDIVQQYRERVAHYALMGDAAFSNNDLTTAEALYSNAIALNSTDNYARIQLAAVYAISKETDQAVAQLSKVESPSSDEQKLVANVHKLIGS